MLKKPLSFIDLARILPAGRFFLDILRLHNDKPKPLDIFTLLTFSGI
jgi:hypothetical protein